MPGTRYPRRWIAAAALVITAITVAAWLTRPSPGAGGSAADRDAVFVQLHQRDQLRERMRRTLIEAVGRADGPWLALEPPPRSLLVPDLQPSLLDLRRALDGPGLTRLVTPPLGLLDSLGAHTVGRPPPGQPPDGPLPPEPDSSSLLSDTIAPPRPTPPPPLTLVDH